MRETMKNIIYSLLITTMIASCGDAPEEHSDTNSLESSSLQYMNITNAESVFISSNNSSGRTSSRNYKEKKLFQLTKDGAVLEIEYRDSDNNTYTVTNQPISIYNVNTDYVVFSFGEDENNVTECYLTEKSTGRAYTLGNSNSPLESKCPVPQNNSVEKTILTDNNSNLYYRYYAPISGNSFYYLRQVNYEDFSTTQYINDTDSIDNFIVDSNGNVVYTAYTTAGDVTTEVRRIRKSNGDYHNLESDASYWIGLDGSIKTSTNPLIRTYLTNQHYKLYQEDKLILFNPMGNEYLIDNGKELVTKELTKTLLISFLLEIKCKHTFECLIEK